MIRGGIVLMGVMVGCSGATPPAAPVVPATKGPEPAAKPAPAPEPAPPPIETPAAAAGRHAAPALRAWIATQRVSAARQTAVPAPVAAELVALAQPSYDEAKKAYLYDQAAKPLEVQWVRVLAREGNAATVAFAVGHPMKPSYGGDAAALRGFVTARIGAGEAAAPAVIWDTDDPTQDVNDISFEDDRDIDGDGLADQLIFTYSGRGGGGHDYSGTMILLGSKNGSAIEVQTEHRDAEYEGGEPYSSDTQAAVHCWTRVGASHPVLLRVMTSADSYQDDGGEGAGVFHSALAADGAGTLHAPAVYATIAGKAASADALAGSWRTLAGAGAGTEPAFASGEDAYIPIGCSGQRPAVIIPGNGTMTCPDNDCAFAGEYLLLTDFAFTEADAVRLYRERTGATDAPGLFEFAPVPQSR